LIGKNKRKWKRELIDKVSFLKKSHYRTVETTRTHIAIATEDVVAPAHGDTFWARSLTSKSLP